MAESEAKAPAAGGKKKLILLAVVALVVLGGGGAGAAYFKGLFGGAASGGHAAADEGGAQAAEPAHEAEGQAKGEVAFVDLPDIIVNLQAGGNRPRFLKLKVALEVDDARAADRIEALMPRVLDSFQLYLRALKVEEVDGSSGMQRLKEELTARVNLAVAPVAVTDVLLKEMLVQ